MKLCLRIVIGCLGGIALVGCSTSKKEVGGMHPGESPIVIASGANLMVPPNSEPPILKDPQSGALVLTEDPSAPLVNFAEEE